MILSVVGGIDGTFSTGVPWSWGRRHRAWILVLYLGTRVALLGWFSFLFGISNTLCKYLILPTNPRGPNVPSGWSYCFHSWLFEAYVGWLLLGWQACPGIPAEAMGSTQALVAGLVRFADAIPIYGCLHVLFTGALLCMLHWLPPAPGTSDKSVVGINGAAALFHCTEKGLVKAGGDQRGKKVAFKKQFRACLCKGVCVLSNKTCG